jgi:hypothetical protein
VKETRVSRVLKIRVLKIVRLDSGFKGVGSLTRVLGFQTLEMILWRI